jgi:hypothetical protein
LLAQARQGAATGSVATLSSPELVAADRNLDRYMLQECGYDQITIGATDHAYQGVPRAVPAGTFAVTLRNQGQDAHQAVISRAKDGVALPYPATVLGLVQADPARPTPSSCG